MSPSLPQILIVLLLIVLLFGRGKISDLMGDVAKGITSFRKGLKEGNEELSDDEGTVIDNETGEKVNSADPQKPAS